MNLIEFLFKAHRKIRSLIATQCFYRFGFKSFGKKSRIYFPEILSGINNISIGDNVSIFDGAWLMTIPGLAAEKPNVRIGSNTYIGRRLHLVAVRKVDIGLNVLIADNVFITDSAHDFYDTCRPVKDQLIAYLGDVVIGEGSWIGENVVVSGVKIGKNSVVGANSFVNRDVPDFCVVAGSPARIIKRLN